MNHVHTCTQDDCRSAGCSHPISPRSLGAFATPPPNAHPCTLLHPSYQPRSLCSVANPGLFPACAREQQQMPRSCFLAPSPCVSQHYGHTVLHVRTKRCVVNDSNIPSQQPLSALLLPYHATAQGRKIWLQEGTRNPASLTLRG